MSGETILGGEEVSRYAKSSMTISPRKSNEVLYVWAKKENYDGQPAKEPSYFSIEGKLGIDWLKISEKEYDLARKILKESARQPGYSNLFGEESNLFQFNDCLVRLAFRYINSMRESQNFLCVSSERRLEDKIKPTLLMLGLPAPVVLSSKSL